MIIGHTEGPLPHPRIPIKAPVVPPRPGEVIIRYDLEQGEWLELNCKGWFWFVVTLLCCPPFCIIPVFCRDCHSLRQRPVYGPPGMGYLGSTHIHIHEDFGPYASVPTTQPGFGGPYEPPPVVPSHTAYYEPAPTMPIAPPLGPPALGVPAPGIPYAAASGYAPSAPPPPKGYPPAKQV